MHIGARNAEGLVRWSHDTQEHELALIQSRTRDAVKTFLSVDYITTQITKLEQTAGIEVRRPAETVRTVGKKLTFSDAQIEGVLEQFIRGGQTTAGGLMQAVTSVAQEIPDADVAAEVESQGARAMQLAAAS